MADIGAVQSFWATLPDSVVSQDPVLKFFKRCGAFPRAGSRFARLIFAACPPPGRRLRPPCRRPRRARTTDTGPWRRWCTVGSVARPGRPALTAADAGAQIADLNNAVDAAPNCPPQLKSRSRASSFFRLPPSNSTPVWRRSHLRRLQQPQPTHSRTGWLALTYRHGARVRSSRTVRAGQSDWFGHL